jgi:hypothetical protein
MKASGAKCQDEALCIFTVGTLREFNPPDEQAEHAAERMARPR